MDCVFSQRNPKPFLVLNVLLHENRSAGYSLPLLPIGISALIGFPIYASSVLISFAFYSPDCIYSSSASISCAKMSRFLHIQSLRVHDWRRKSGGPESGKTLRETALPSLLDNGKYYGCVFVELGDILDIGCHKVLTYH
jgi:hypothetical protein